MIHFIQSSLPTGRHPTFLSPSLLVPEFPLSPLVAEYLDLRIATVSGLLSNLRSGIVKRVDLYVQWKTFNSFLCTEIQGITF